MAPSTTNARPRRLLRLPQLFLFVLVGFCSLSTAIMQEIVPIDGVAVPTDALLVDNSVPVLVGDEWTWISDDDAEVDLRKRQDKDEEETTTVSSSSQAARTSGISSVSSASKTTAVTSSKAVATTAALPSPFDSGLDFKFTSNGGKSCPNFLNEMLLDETFKSCYPVSLMLETSRAFFEASKSLPTIVTVLDAACDADVDFCTKYLKEKAKELILDENCGGEFASNLSNIQQAYVGLRAYNVLYKATCLRDRENDDMYCFANAITNTSTPANAYFYFLPLGKSLPQSANPACSTCLQDMMAIYQSAGANRKQPIADTYVAAAQSLNAICGPQFANDTLPDEVEDAAGRLAISSLAVLVTVLALLFNSI